MTVRCINANAVNGLKGIPGDSIDCVVTSPPYWGLRDYGTGSWGGGDPDCDHRSPSMRGFGLLIGSPATNSAQLPPHRRSCCGKCCAVRRDEQIGLEPTFKQHIEVLTAVFREVWRVLKPGGTLWLNYGDSYATTPNGNAHLTHDGRYKSTRDDRPHAGKPFSTIGAGHKHKDLSLISARLAIALCDDGWWLRADNIRVKPNAKPESVKDRPAQAHEHVFLFTESERYFYDSEAVREPHATPPQRGGHKHAQQAQRCQQCYFHPDGRNLRNVWVIPAEPYPGARFTTMPAALAELYSHAVPFEAEAEAAGPGRAAASRTCKAHPAAKHQGPRRLLRRLRGACGSARHQQGRALQGHGGRAAGDGAAARLELGLSKR